MPTLPCPRCGEPRTAHLACPACGAPGLETDVPPLPDVAFPAAPALASAVAPGPSAPDLSAPDDSAPGAALPSIPAGPGPFGPSVEVAARPQRSDVLGRIGYFVAAALAVGALLLFHGIARDDDPVPPLGEPVPAEAAPAAPEGGFSDVPPLPDVPAPPPLPDVAPAPAPPPMPDIPRPPGMSDAEWDELQRSLEQVQRDAQEAAREAERALRGARGAPPPPAEAPSQSP